METTLIVVAAIATALLLLGLLLIRRSVRRAGWTRRARSWIGVTAGALLLGLSMLLLVDIYRAAGPSDAPGMPDAEEWAVPVPALEYRTIAGDRPATLSAHAGDVVLLSLWATWCGPCLNEMPTLERLQAELGARGLVVITLTNDDRDQVLEFQDRLPEGTVNVYADEDDLASPFRHAFRTLPMTYIIDRSGHFREAFIGTRSFDDFRARVEPLL